MVLDSPPPTIDFNHGDEGWRFADNNFGDLEAGKLTDKPVMPVKR